MAQFHVLTASQIATMGPGNSGDIYYASDTGAIYLCVTGGALFPMSGLVSGGIALNLASTPGPQGLPGVPFGETPKAINLLEEGRPCH